jgi:hypothetical protein
VSLSPSTTRPFDAPEFILTQRHRHPTRGHGFLPACPIQSQPSFLAQFRGLYDSPFHGATLPYTLPIFFRYLYPCHSLPGHFAFPLYRDGRSCYYLHQPTESGSRFQHQASSQQVRRGTGREYPRERLEGEFAYSLLPCAIRGNGAFVAE